MANKWTDVLDIGEIVLEVKHEQRSR